MKIVLGLRAFMCNLQTAMLTYFYIKFYATKKKLCKKYIFTWKLINPL